MVYVELQRLVPEAGSLAGAVKCLEPNLPPPSLDPSRVARLTVYLGYAPVVLLGVLLCSSLGEQDMCRNCNHPLLALLLGKQICQSVG